MLPLSEPSFCCAPARAGIAIRASVLSAGWMNRRMRMDMGLVLLSRTRVIANTRRLFSLRAFSKDPLLDLFLLLLLLLLRRRWLPAGRGAIGKLFLVFLGRQVDPPDPRESHFVDRPVAVANPVLRIGVVLIGRRVVVPADDVDHRSGRHERRSLILVVVNRMPVVVPVRAVDRLALHHVAGIT